MLVHIALNAGCDPLLCRKVADCIHRAIEAALGSSCEDIVLSVTERVPHLTIRQRRPAGHAVRRDAAVVILMYPRSRYGDGRKRDLFGRIGEALGKEFQISRRDLVMGVIDTPARNWTFGYDQTELALAMQGQLP